MSDQKRQIWFATYGRWPGLMFRVPVHWKGWLIQFAAIVALLFVIVVSAAGGLIQKFPPLCMVAGLIAYIAVMSLGRQHHEER